MEDKIEYGLEQVTAFSVAEMTRRLMQADQERQQIRRLTLELRSFGRQLRPKNGYSGAVYGAACETKFEN